MPSEVIPRSQRVRSCTIWALARESKVRATDQWAQYTLEHYPPGRNPPCDYGVFGK
jgi:hypothetical protein